MTPKPLVCFTVCSLCRANPAARAGAAQLRASNLKREASMKDQLGLVTTRDEACAGSPLFEVCCPHILAPISHSICSSRHSRMLRAQSRRTSNFLQEVRDVPWRRTLSCILTICLKQQVGCGWWRSSSEDKTCSGCERIGFETGEKWRLHDGRQRGFCSTFYSFFDNGSFFTWV